MENPLKKGNLLVPLIALVILLVVGGLYSQRDRFGAMNPTQNARYNILGTSASPITLTSAYTGAGSASTTARLMKSMPNVVVSGTYTPKSHGSVLQVLVERSIDDGVTYQPYNLLELNSNEVLVHTSGTTGIPFRIPGSGTAASGTAMNFSFDLTMAGDYVKISAKETTTSTAGTFYGHLLFQSL